jgi:hypothetical protein
MHRAKTVAILFNAVRDRYHRPASPFFKMRAFERIQNTMNNRKMSSGNGKTRLAFSSACCEKPDHARLARDSRNVTGCNHM